MSQVQRYWDLNVAPRENMTFVAELQEQKKDFRKTAAALF